MYLSQEFHDHYGRDKKRGLNRAIRAEVPAMNELMDAIEGLDQAVRYESGKTKRLLLDLLEAMLDARDCAKELIINKYLVDYEGESKPTPLKTAPAWKNFIERGATDDR